LPPQADIIIQVHYHPSGKPESDRTRLGLYYARESSPGSGSGRPRNRWPIRTDNRPVPGGRDRGSAQPGVHSAAAPVRAETPRPESQRPAPGRAGRRGVVERSPLPGWALDEGSRSLQRREREQRAVIGPLEDEASIVRESIR
jgi:hypothetical protein